MTAGDLGRAPRGWWRVAGDGRVMSRELRGRPVVISFWEPECRPCRAEARMLEQVWQEAGAGVLVLGVSTAPSSARTRALIHALGLSFPQAHDPTGEAAQRWGVDGVPEIFFLARDGRIVGHIVGAATAAHVREGIRAALTGRPSGLRTGGARDRL